MQMRVCIILKSSPSLISKVISLNDIKCFIKTFYWKYTKIKKISIMLNHHVLSLEHTSVCITMFTFSYMNTPEVNACSLIVFLWFCFRFVVHPFHYPGFSTWVTESMSQHFTCYGKEKATPFRRESPTLRLKKVCRWSEIIQISLISCKWVRASVLFLGAVLFFKK